MFNDKKVKTALDKDRVALHRFFTSHQHIYVPVEDDIYKDRFDFEELAVEPVKVGRVKGLKILCTPFLLYGLNRGDLVTADGASIFKKKLFDDGQYGYRIAFEDFTDDHQAHTYIEGILETLTKQGFETEPLNHKVSAVNAINAEEAVRLEQLLQRMIANQQIIAFDTVR